MRRSNRPRRKTVVTAGNADAEAAWSPSKKKRRPY